MKPTTSVSKFLSLVLRHRPEIAGIHLDDEGWVSVEELIAGCVRCGMPLDADALQDLVRTNDKQRFALSDDGSRIRASQGHTVKVSLGYEPVEPPEVLFHGTVSRFLDSIRAEGLLRGQRHHVHLSETRETAVKVGSRRGRPVVLTVRAGEMHGAGFVFFRSDNGVWLTDHVPAGFVAEL
jgi:putative RNA 2'-phosphotransferase